MSSVNELLNYFVVNDDKDDVAKGVEGAKSRAEQLERERQKENERAVVRRYFPGKKPHYAKNAKEDDEEDDGEDDEEEEDTLFARIKGDERERITRRVREVKVINHPEEVKDEGLPKSRGEGGEEAGEADNYEEYFPVGQEEAEQEAEEEGEEAEDEDEDEDESSNSYVDQSDDQSDDENYMNGEDGIAPMKHEYVFKTKRKTLLETFEKEQSEKQLLKDEEKEKKN
ncbi:Micro-fibrillar-associated protein 1 C-terminus domain containing protein [Plasmodium cynomolgi strain B]|uniref:Micro-fibrillar-associated protein 1 C-terminus domain containing protein n=1 Tax=Plasmodium cynomolgi (strain B) TaxID=1120755 RepID=K6UYW0_PLACD|nr:Micro-fibrillar-associated protein 1 C-terminus domain containing protein [Plasmodium cynomolgi strain B]GAB67820.1 Micro-fibrillar-associated protein 1 C-terminus domain containing protein [Plasmodium cynomolgi strain B]